MNREDVDRQVQLVKDAVVIKGDLEAAHGLEEELFIAVLTAIADGSSDENARSLARGALESRALEFDRWYA